VRSLLELVLPLRATTLADAPTTAVVQPFAEPYHAGQGSVGVLLIHGFTGSPRSMRAWAEHLVADGFRVAVPRLPGHGTSWQELALTGWQDWYGAVERELDALRETCDRVFVCGLSLGGCLALLLAARRGDQIGGVVLVNPVVTSTDRRLLVLPVLRRFVPSLAGVSNDIALAGVDEGAYPRSPLPAAHSMVQLWRLTRDQLHRVDRPLLMFRSVQDHTVDPTSGRAILAAVRSSDVHEVLLHRSYHVATMDHEAEEIFSGSSAFFHRLLKD
jgi:carboxylesterase